MAADRNNRQYEELYTELLGRGEMLHESNKRRIRRGIITLVILPFILEFIRWMTDSDKVVFLIIWIFIMFVLSAYLISIEYLDYSVEATLRDVTDSEADFDGLLPKPELPRGDLHERIRARFAELRSKESEDGDDDEVREAEAAMEELNETVPAELITAMKEAFDADIKKHEKMAGSGEDAPGSGQGGTDAAGEEVPE